jgi:hypothetical protein
MRLAAVVAATVVLGGCAGPTSLQRVVEQQSLPPAVELADTPFFPQSEYQCGPAALATLLGAAGLPESPATLVEEIYLPARRGSLQPEIVAAIRARDLLPYVLRPDLETVLAEVAAGRPVLVLQRLGIGPWPAWHYAVVAGYDAEANHLLLRSGTEARQQLSPGVFLSTWDRADRWSVIALPPGVLPARPDPGRYIEAAAALEATGKVTAARAAYAAAASEWPAEPLPQLGLANLAAAAGDWTEAERGYRAALAADPANVAAQNNRAEALRQMGCLDAANDTLELALAQAPRDHPLYGALQATAAGVAAARTPTRADAPACGPLAAAAAPGTPLP